MEQQIVWEVTLQAYQNQLPVSHIYNHRKLRWTKNQGWLKTLDWFAFPYGFSGLVSNPLYTYNNFAAQEDTAAYDRISDTVNLDYGYTLSDLQSHYQPGNAWRTYYEKGEYTDKSYYRYDYDSILSMTTVGNKCIVQMHSSSCEFRFVPPSGPSNPIGYWQATPQTGTLHTDSVTADSVIIPKRLWITPDELQGSTGWYNYLLTDTLCGKPVVTRDFEAFAYCNPQMSVCTMSSGNSGVANTSYLPQIAKLRSLSIGPFSELYVIYHYSRLDYLKTASCTFGNYINVPALSVRKATMPETQITLSPNPADKFLTIDVPESLADGLFSITDIQGKAVLNGQLQKGQTVVSVAEIPAGLYLIRISGNAVQQVQKFLIQR